MMQWVILPVLLPLMGGFIQLFARAGGLKTQRIISFILLMILNALAVALFFLAAQGQHHVYNLGNWIAPFGIVLVLDRLSALMVLLTSVLALAAWLYAVVTRTDAKGEHFHVLYQLQLFGLNGAFLTGDVFNLFVFFEVLLLASYGLLLHGLGRKRTKAGLHYVSINLVGSILFLFALGALYGAVGTLNLADLAVKIGQAPAERTGLIMAASLLLLAVFALKAAMFPLYLWLPAAYSSTSAPVAALFAIMTKVGLYAIIRVHGTMLGAEAGSLAYAYVPWVLAGGLITLAMAAFGALSTNYLKEQVAYLVLGSVATLFIAIGLNTPQALSASLYYLVHSTLLAGAFFLLADLISQARGQAEDRLDKAPLMPRAYYLRVLFFALAVAMVGLPPLSGFFGKAMILNAAIGHTWQIWILATVLSAGLLMLVAMAQSGVILFFRPTPSFRDGPDGGDQKTPSWDAISVVALLTLIAPLLVIFAQPITRYNDQISQQLYDLPAYIQAVLSNSSVVGEKP